MTYPRLLRWLPLALALGVVMPLSWKSAVPAPVGAAPAVQIDISTLAVER